MPCLLEMCKGMCGVVAAAAYIATYQTNPKILFGVADPTFVGDVFGGVGNMVSLAST